MPDRIQTLLVAGGLLVLVGGALAYTYRDTLGLTEPSTEEQVENLRAFAKLYGYVRYFHPSDAAAKTDWEKFAIYGVQQVKDASNQAELRADLQALFKPIAPTVQLYRTDAAPPDPPGMLTPPDTASLRLVAWQHKGHGMETKLPRYFTSRRINRRGVALGVEETTEGKKERPGGKPAAGLTWQAREMERFYGKEVRLRASVKTAGKAGVWIGLYTSQQDSWKGPTGYEQWTQVQITGRVPENARFLRVGAAIEEEGQAWIDRIELQVRKETSGDWRSVSIPAPSFERGEGLPEEWRASEDIGTGVLVTSAAGRRLVRLHKGSPSEVRLFKEAPRPGETVEKEIGRGLGARSPRAVE